MKYYNVNIYNYENLSPEDKRFLDGLRFAVSIASHKENIIDDLGLTEKEDLISQIKKEITGEVLDAVVNRIQTVQTETIISLIDQYETLPNTEQ